jgi:hypothetical protein
LRALSYAINTGIAVVTEIIPTHNVPDYHKKLRKLPVDGGKPGYSAK